MNKIEILVTGQGTKNLETFNDLLSKNDDWSIVTATNGEEAIEKFHRHNFEVAVFANNINNDEERKLRKIFTFHNPEIIIVKHQDENEGALVAEIVTALDKLQKTKRPSYSLVDDALKNAGLNIIIE